MSYKILIKDSDKNLKLKSVRFELLTKEENALYFEIDIKSEKEKIISLKPNSVNVLDFSYKKNVTIGQEQYYNVECEIHKRDPSVQVDHLVLKFFLSDEVDLTRSFMPKHLSNII